MLSLLQRGFFFTVLMSLVLEKQILQKKNTGMSGNVLRIGIDRRPNFRRISFPSRRLHVAFYNPRRPTHRGCSFHLCYITGSRTLWCAAIRCVQQLFWLPVKMIKFDSRWSCRRIISDSPDSFNTLGVIQRFFRFHFCWISFGDFGTSPSPVWSDASFHGSHVRDWRGNLCDYCPCVGLPVWSKSAAQDCNFNWVNFYRCWFPFDWTRAFLATRYVSLWLTQFRIL